MKAIYLSLGSNLGEREENLLFGIDRLKWEAGTLLKVSPLFMTEHIGPPAPDHYNCVVEVDSPLSPPELLQLCHRIEAARGRDRRNEVRWGARMLDIDILLYGSQQINSANLTVPHPRMMQRRFVLAPLAALDPDLEIPVLM